MRDPCSLEKLACGRFSDISSVTPAKGVTFAGCLVAGFEGFSPTGG
jgi:hypothetical protein